MDELRTQAREKIAPLLETLDRIKRMEQEYKGGQYYYVFKNNIEGYKQWQEKIETAQQEYHRVWQSIGQQYKDLTGEVYPDDHRSPEAKSEISTDKLFDQKGSVSQPALGAAIQEQQDATHAAILLDWGLVTKRGAATGVLRHGVKSPHEFIQEMRDFRAELMHNDATRFPDNRLDRARVFDDTYGFYRYARGFGLAAFEAGDYGIAGEAVGFSQRIARLPNHEEGRLKNLLLKASPAARAQFAEGLRTYQVR